MNELMIFFIFHPWTIVFIYVLISDWMTLNPRSHNFINIVHIQWSLKCQNGCYVVTKVRSTYMPWQVVFDFDFVASCVRLQCHCKLRSTSISWKVAFDFDIMASCVRLRYRGKLRSTPILIHQDCQVSHHRRW